MMGDKRIGIFYGSSTGNTESAAKIIGENLNGFSVKLHDVAKTSVDKISEYDILIFGMSTWGIGGIQDDFEEFLGELDLQTLRSKTVAMFGLGDQFTYTDCFANGLGKAFLKIREAGANMIGQWENKGYTFKNSEAIIDNKFVGLVIDEDSQEELTTGRIKKWAGQLKQEIV